jgi:hypothetical protein
VTRLLLSPELVVLERVAVVWLSLGRACLLVRGVVELELSNALVVVVPGVVVRGGSGPPACGSAIPSVRYTTIFPVQDPLCTSTCYSRVAHDVQ